MIRPTAAVVGDRSDNARRMARQLPSALTLNPGAIVGALAVAVGIAWIATWIVSAVQFVGRGGSAHASWPDAYVGPFIGLLLAVVVTSFGVLTVVAFGWSDVIRLLPWLRVDGRAVAAADLPRRTAAEIARDGGRVLFAVSSRSRDLEQPLAFMWASVAFAAVGAIVAVLLASSPGSPPAPLIVVWSVAGVSVLGQLAFAVRSVGAAVRAADLVVGTTAGLYAAELVGVGESSLRFVDWAQLDPREAIAVDDDGGRGRVVLPLRSGMDDWAEVHGGGPRRMPETIVISGAPDARAVAAHAAACLRASAAVGAHTPTVRSMHAAPVDDSRPPAVEAVLARGAPLFAVKTKHRAPGGVTAIGLTFAAALTTISGSLGYMAFTAPDAAHPRLVQIGTTAFFLFGVLLAVLNAPDLFSRAVWWVATEDGLAQVIGEAASTYTWDGFVADVRVRGLDGKGTVTLTLQGGGIARVSLVHVRDPVTVHRICRDRIMAARGAR